MPAIQCLLVNEHVTLKAVGVGPDDLLQDNNGILQVVVCKVNLYVGTVGCSLLISCHWEPEVSERRW